MTGFISLRSTAGQLLQDYSKYNWLEVGSWTAAIGLQLYNRPGSRAKVRQLDSCSRTTESILVIRNGISFSVVFFKPQICYSYLPAENLQHYTDF